MSEKDLVDIENTNEKEEDKDKSEYEDVCYICHRPESKAGEMVKIPGNICICKDCMQKTFDSMNSNGFKYDDIMNMSKMPNISMINLSDLQGMIPNRQKIKKKQPKKRRRGSKSI